MEIITGKIIPSVAVLDPECTLSLPPKVTASTGFDALTHAIEALWSLQANPLSQTEAYAALALIRDHLEKAVDNPRDTHARLALANGSYLAGAAFSNAMVGAVHAIGHAAGAVCHVAHGDIMAVLLPAVMQANLPAAEDTIGELLYWLEGASVMAETPAAERALKAIESIRALRRRLKEKAGLAETLRDLNITETSFDAICEKALDDGAGMTNPIPLDHAFVRQVLELCR